MHCFPRYVCFLKLPCTFIPLHYSCHFPCLQHKSKMCSISLLITASNKQPARDNPSLTASPPHPKDAELLAIFSLKLRMMMQFLKPICSGQWALKICHKSFNWGHGTAKIVTCLRVHKLQHKAKLILSLSIHFHKECKDNFETLKWEPWDRYLTV